MSDLQTAIRFYHVENGEPDKALIALTMKAWQSGHKILLKVDSDKEAKRLDDLMWTFHPHAFLPHGQAGKGNDDCQPVLITTGNDNVNGADTIVLYNGSTFGGDIGQFSLCCEVLDGRIEDHIQSARTRWKDYKNKGYDLTYWQQSESARWVQKA